MTAFTSDQLDRSHFSWPEPLVIEIISDHGASLLPSGQRTAVAQQHATLLRGMVEGAAPGSTTRDQLLTRYAAFGLGPDVVAKVEEAVFFELMRLVGCRFRNSTRLREEHSARLQAALSAVSKRPEVPSRRPVLKRSRANPWRGLALAAT